LFLDYVVSNYCNFTIQDSVLTAEAFEMLESSVVHQAQSTFFLDPVYLAFSQHFLWSAVQSSIFESAYLLGPSSRSGWLLADLPTARIR
jgi:hypothetical protein